MANKQIRNLTTQQSPAHVVDVDHEGRGVARVNGKTVFIENALPGETVQWWLLRDKKSFMEGVATHWFSQSNLRITPPCALVSQCGGCHWQHIEANAQVALKQRVWEAQMCRLGKVFPEQILPPIYGLPWHYRQRVRLSVQWQHGQFALGFQSHRSHNVVDVAACRVLPESVSATLLEIHRILAAYAASCGISAVSIHVGDAATALCIQAKKTWSPRQYCALTDWLDTMQRRPLPWQLWWQIGQQTVQRVYPQTAPDLAYRLPEYQLRLRFTPDDFTQVNSETNALMVHRAMQCLVPKKGERIIDWFCGLGNFSLPTARLGATVLGVEGVETMVRKARQNAKTNGLAQVAGFQASNLFDVNAHALKKFGHADKWLLDPPRAGAQALLQSLSGLPETNLPQRIVYVSCNPGTLARDAAVLVARGYRFSAGGIMNLFAQTSHVESIAVFDWPQPTP